MSKLRKTIRANDLPCPTNGTALLMILNAVKPRSGLIHGTLHQNGEHCAIGSFFHVNKGQALSEDLIDEVAAVNDSVPYLSPFKRKQVVQKWLRWKLQQLGLKGV